MKSAIKFLPFLLMTAVDASDYVAATLILEAGGESDSRAMEAVYEVIVNRSEKRNLSTEDVVLQRKQFSCWNNISRHAALIAHAKKHPKWDRAVQITQSPVTNHTNGADHYHADYVNPYWAKHMTKTITIEKHIFYK
jgi:spore germination cell wall hydrolase CwlJ-like protein